MQNRARHRTEHRAIPKTVAVRSRDDQISRPFFRLFDDYAGRRTVNDFRRNIQRATGKQTTQLALSILGLGIGASAVNPATEQNPMSGIGTGAGVCFSS